MSGGVPPAPPEAVGLSAERIGWVRSMVADHVGSGRTPSAAIAVARKGKLVLAEAFGEHRPGEGPLEIDHVWPLASAGKPVTAAVLMTLVEEGRVGITQPIVDFFPELRDSGNDQVLVHHLLTHTAGWESAQRTQRIVKSISEGLVPPVPDGDNPTDHLFRWLAFNPIRVADPGERMDYDNSHYTLLSEIVRRVTAAPSTPPRGHGSSNRWG